LRCTISPNAERFAPDCQKCTEKLHGPSSWRTILFERSEGYSGDEESESLDWLKKRVEKMKLVSEIDDVWTVWINSIRKAKLKIIPSHAAWSNDDTYIQIKRMTESDLSSCIAESRKLDSDHEYEKVLDVVKFPMAIPEYAKRDASNFLFIRPDEYKLFYAMQKT
jgi:hypothetical protein